MLLASTVTRASYLFHGSMSFHLPTFQVRLILKLFASEQRGLGKLPRVVIAELIPSHSFSVR